MRELPNSHLWSQWILEEPGRRLEPGRRWDPGRCRGCCPPPQSGWRRLHRRSVPEGVEGVSGSLPADEDVSHLLAPGCSPLCPPLKLHVKTFWFFEAISAISAAAAWATVAAWLLSAVNRYRSAGWLRCGADDIIRYWGWGCCVMAPPKTGPAD